MISDLKSTISIWKLAKRISVWTILFWLSETISFLIIEGWHWKATSRAEILCDSIVTLAVNVIIILFFVVFINVIDYLLTPSKAKEGEK